MLLILIAFFWHPFGVHRCSIGVILYEMLSHHLWYVAWFGRRCGKDAIALRRGLRHGKGGALKALP